MRCEGAGGPAGSGNGREGGGGRVGSLGRQGLGTDYAVGTKEAGLGARRPKVWEGSRKAKPRSGCKSQERACEPGANRSQKEGPTITPGGEGKQVL